MKILTIYNSKTGFTKKYIDFLKEDIDMDVVSIDKIKSVNINDYDKVIFASWIFGGKIKKLEFLEKLNTAKEDIIVLAVGASLHNNEVLSDISKLGYHGFYLQGGLAYDKMGFLDKKMIGMFAKALKTKDDLSDDEKILADLIQDSFDMCSKDNLNDVVDYLKKL
ncbi:menaquinone-dependent protoporphyrinogen IX oxidase [Bacilli bacterium PM5-9]|nr:menaquinone-dependent protoporphyrinogen IX oxidase [Bacilli bacterium PM5-9]